jgi:hypothetical protein
MEEVNKGFEGFTGLLRSILDEAKIANELFLDTDSAAVAETLFAGMLGASVLYGVDKDQEILDRSINSLIDYVFQLRNEHFQEQNI